MRKKLLIFSLLSLVFYFSACSPKPSEVLLAKYDGGNVSVGEFEKAYAKNVGSIEKAKKDSLDQYQKFLDLYVNFKLKVKDAHERGYDKDSSMQAELNDYKKKVGVSYLLDKELVEPAIKKLYEQRKTELRVSHIMIRPDSTGDEAAKAKAEMVLKKALAGEKFEDLVKEYSSDQYSKQNSGDIYYITAGLIVPEFEEAAYKTEVGKVYPYVVKTRFGYHIIKVTEKRERIPAVRASHIMITFNNDAGQPDTLAAFKKIDSIKTLLKNGADFANLAHDFSKDPGSANKGGDLGLFQRRMMVKEFDEAAFNLKVGEVSDIVKTNYGYHIIKQTGRTAYPTFEENKDELKQIYKDTRYNADYDTLLTFYRNKYHFTLNQVNLDAIQKANDTVKVNGDFYGTKLWKEFRDSTIFSVGGVAYSLNWVIDKVISEQEYMHKVITAELLKKAALKYGADLALDDETLVMEKRYPEYADLMEEYKNGIFIFKLQEAEIWNKIKIDDEKLLEFYNKTKENYKWNDRVSFSEIYTRRDSIIQLCKKLLADGVSFDSLAAKYTERAGMKSKAGKYELIDVETTQISQEANKLENVGEVSPVIANGGGYSLLRLDEKSRAHQKTFEEAKAEVSGAFQEAESKRLEKDYDARLHTKYNPVLMESELSKVFKSE